MQKTNQLHEEVMKQVAAEFFDGDIHYDDDGIKVKKTRSPSSSSSILSDKKNFGNDNGIDPRSWVDIEDLSPKKPAPKTKCNKPKWKIPKKYMITNKI